MVKSQIKMLGKPFLAKKSNVNIYRTIDAHSIYSNKIPEIDRNVPSKSLVKLQKDRNNAAQIEKTLKNRVHLLKMEESKMQAKIREAST